MKKSIGEFMDIIRKILTLRVLPSNKGILEKKLKSKEEKNKKMYINASISVLGAKKY